MNNERVQVLCFPLFLLLKMNQEFDFSPATQSLVTAVFTLKPDNPSEDFSYLQLLYQVAPDKFQILGDIHSTEEDPIPHISLRLYVHSSFFHTFHVYLNIIHGRFYITKLTRMIKGAVTTLATFSPLPPKNPN
jgi:hypothetical protein